jgi:hypothetical protein
VLQLTSARSSAADKARVLTPLAFLLAVRLALGVLYSVSVPVWESYDEDGHFAYARYLAKYRRLLRSGDPEAEQIWEKFQPPLYYLLIAPSLAVFDLGPTFQAPERNPYFAYGNAGLNYALHPDTLDELAYQTALAVHVARLISVVLSTVSVVFVYHAARRVWPRESRPINRAGERSAVWAATCLYAFWPQFLFVGSMVTNDALVASLAAAVFYFAIALSGLSQTEGFQLRQALPMGLFLGAALLTKLNAIALIPMAAVALILSLVFSNPARQTPKRAFSLWKSRGLWLALAVLMALIAAALGLLGSLNFVTAQVFQLGTLREFLRYTPGIGVGQAQSSVDLSSALRYGFRTFLASYGWGNLEGYPWLYWLWSLGAGLALIGWVVSAVQRRIGSRQLKLFVMMSLQVLSSVALAAALAIAHQDRFLVPGRYLLPALPAVIFLLVSGWQALIPNRLRSLSWKSLGLGVLLVGWAIPFTVLIPTYAKPQPLQNRSPNFGDAPLSVMFGEKIELIGYPRPPAATPGTDWKVSLCWKARAPISENHTVFLGIVGPDGQGYGQLRTYPGKGNYPTSLWAANVPFCDEYSFPIGKGLPAPSAASLSISLLPNPFGEGLPVVDSAGRRYGQEFRIPVKARPANKQVPELANSVEYRFGHKLALRGYEIRPLTEGNQGVQVLLRWEALEDIRENYIVFVHLRDTPQTAYAQSDGPPRQGWYPTWLWEKGEVVLDQHRLHFPTQTPTPPLDLYIGLLDAGNRVPVVDAQGNPVLNHEVILARGLVFP